MGLSLEAKYELIRAMFTDFEYSTGSLKFRFNYLLTYSRPYGSHDSHWVRMHDLFLESQELYVNIRISDIMMELIRCLI